jgi:phosphoglycolate phosphatase-like HAD superfamily hydrolase
MYQSANTLPRPGVIIFDVDGTLIDVSESYRESVPLAASHYLEMLGITPPSLTGDVYDTFKRMGGFNDDWDLTAGLLRVILAPLPAAPPLPGRLWSDLDTLIAVLKETTAPLAGLTAALPDLDVLVAPVRAAGGGLAGLAQVIGDRNSHLVWRTPDVPATDLVQYALSEVYLGEELFAECYHFRPRFQPGPGLIHKEKLLIGLDTLEWLSQHARLGIATGRSRFELAYPMRYMGLNRFFGVATTMNDAMAARQPGGESLLKPHPFLLLRAADALDPPESSGANWQFALRSARLRQAAYVGDAPDDIVAARRADSVGSRRWLAIGLAGTPTQREDYLALGADVVLEHPDELLEVW